MRRVFLAVLVVVLLVHPAWGQRAPKQPIFVFHSDEFWLNLHHFLYVLGRAENKTRDSSRTAVVSAPYDQQLGFKKLSDAERAIWHDAVVFYANGLSKKDAVFDEPLPAITNALAQARDSKSLAKTNVDAEVTVVLERVAPIYRKAWWTGHHTANIEWQYMIRKFLDEHGRAILRYITKAYELKWNPAGFHVHISAYANWAGAYSTTGELLVLSSLAENILGFYGLETIFHEGMHQWDKQVFEALREQARKQNKLVPDGLSHAMIFFTAGEAVRQFYRDHVPYAEKYDLWHRGLSAFKTPLEEIWKPHLDAHTTRDAALAELIQRTGTEKKL